MTFGRRRILLVEDDSDLVMTLREVLECEGYEVLAAANGEAALRACGSHPSLALVDLHIDGQVTGPHLISALRDHLPLGARLCLLSAERDLPERARELGADGYLEKPFDIEQLLRLVADAFVEVEAPHP